MSGVLEGRYRAALRWYPRAWRAENADAIVGVMLDQADADGRTTPLPGELRNLAASGMSRRLERVAPQVVRDRVAAIALAIGTGHALIMFVAGEWAPFATTGPATGWTLPDGTEFREYSTAGFGPFASAMVIVYALWVVASALVLLRLSRIAIVPLLLTVPVLGWIRSIRSEDIASLQPQTFMLIVIGGLAVLATIGRPARVSQLRIVAIAAAFLYVGMLASLAFSSSTPIFDGRLSPQSAPVWVLFAPVFALVLVLAGAALAVRRHRAWATAAFVSAAPWSFLAALYFLLSWEPTLVAVGAAGLCLVAAILVWNGRASRSRRALD